MKRRFVGRLSLFVLMAFLSMSRAGAQELTISNNLLYDASLTPNLRIGIADSSRWSYGVTVGFRHWPIGNLTKTKWRHLLISPEVRYGKNSLQTGHFFGMNAIYSHFNAGYSDFVIYKGVKDERRQGDGNPRLLFTTVDCGAFETWRIADNAANATEVTNATETTDDNGDGRADCPIFAKLFGCNKKNYYFCVVNIRILLL